MRSAAVFVFAAVLFSGCATLERHQLVPDGAAWRHAAAVAVRDPETWVPAVGAVAIGVSGADRRISNWASDETPLFGSQRNAANASNVTNGTLHLLMLGTALAPDSDGRPLRDRLLVAVENEVVTLPNDFATRALKDAVGRERPDASNRASMPSGHSSTAASYATVTARNAEDVRASERTRRGLVIAARVLLVTTAWARVEAKKHYPTDVLAGAALGNMLTTFFDRAVRDGRGSVVVTIDPVSRSARFVVTIRRAARALR